MIDPLNHYNVVVAVARGSGRLPGPAEFTAAAEQAASSRAASVMTAHTAEKIISLVTVETADKSPAMVVALAVVSETLKAFGGATQPVARRVAMAELVRRLVCQGWSWQVSQNTKEVPYARPRSAPSCAGLQIQGFQPT
jgi:hypothetical protein